MTKYLLALFSMLLCFSVLAIEPEVVALYPAGAGGSNGLTGPEVVEKGNFIVNISQPELHVYHAKESPTGQAVIICPGGGYRGLAWEREGEFVAGWLNERGITAAVLKYRMPNGHCEIPLRDALAGMEIARSRAKDWGVDPSRIGIMGFSAGGHLASTVLTHFSGPGNRPDFGILIYPVVSMDEQLTHAGSRVHLLGKAPSQDFVVRYSNQLHVSADTPPTFIAFSDDDKTVDPCNGTAFYDALRACEVPAELHIYPSGGHGWGFDAARTGFRQRDEFYAALDRWLKSME